MQYKIFFFLLVLSLCSHQKISLNINNMLGPFVMCSPSEYQRVTDLVLRSPSSGVPFLHDPVLFFLKYKYWLGFSLVILGLFIWYQKTSSSTQESAHLS